MGFQVLSVSRSETRPGRAAPLEGGRGPLVGRESTAYRVTHRIVMSTATPIHRLSPPCQTGCQRRRRPFRVDDHRCTEPRLRSEWVVRHRTSGDDGLRFAQSDVVQDVSESRVQCRVPSFAGSSRIVRARAHEINPFRHAYQTRRERCQGTRRTNIVSITFRSTVSRDDVTASVTVRVGLSKQNVVSQ